MNEVKFAFFEIYTKIRKKPFFFAIDLKWERIVGDTQANIWAKYGKFIGNLTEVKFDHNFLFSVFSKIWTKIHKKIVFLVIDLKFAELLMGITVPKLANFLMF